MRKTLSTLLMVIVAFVLVGCGPKQAQLWKNAAPQEKAIFLLEVYNTQWDNYIDIIAYSTGLTAEQVKYMAKNEPEKLKEAIDNSSLTDEARATLRYKKDILSKIDMPVEEFAKLAKAGLPTSAEQEQFIIEMLNKLKMRAYTK